LDFKTTTFTQHKTTSFWPLSSFFFSFLMKIKKKKKKKKKDENRGWLGQNWVVRPPHFWPRAGWSHPTASMGVVKPPPCPRGGSGHPKKRKEKKKE
jgi:hypothetical protein